MSTSRNQLKYCISQGFLKFAFNHDTGRIERDQLKMETQTCESIDTEDLPRQVLCQSMILLNT